MGVQLKEAYQRFARAMRRGDEHAAAAALSQVMHPVCNPEYGAIQSPDETPADIAKSVEPMKRTSKCRVHVLRRGKLVEV